MNNNSSRTKLLYSAYSEFAKNGFSGATTRDIAANANINISSILYYFGGKKGIYTAALENIVDVVKNMTADLQIKYDAVIKSKDCMAARDLIKEVAQKFLYLLCGEKISDDMKMVFFSEYSRPTEEFGILYDGLILPYHNMVANLLNLASSGRISLKDGCFYAFPLFSQMFVFASRKETICQFMEWKHYGEPEVEKLFDYMIKQVDFLIDSHK